MGDSKQVAAGHDMRVYTAAFDPATAMPADTVLWGTSPGGSFADAGYTREGLTVGIQHQWQDILVDQQIDPLYSIAQSREFTLETNLAQVSAANLKTGTGQGTITTSAPGVSTRGHDELAFDSVIGKNFFAVLFDILNPGDGEALRFLGFKGQPRSQVQMRFQVQPGAQVNLRMQLYPDDTTDPAQIALYRDVIPATG